MTSILANQINIDDFIYQLMKIPSQKIDADSLKHLVSQLIVDTEVVNSCIAFSDLTYTRSVLWRTLQFDLHLLCWKPGQGTSIHDHSDAINVTRVWKGELTSRLFKRSSSLDSEPSSIQLQYEEKLSQNQLTVVDRDELHQLVNLSDQELVTLHIYAPPLKRLTIYRPEYGSTEQVRLQYTIEDVPC